MKLNKQFLIICLALFSMAAMVSADFYYESEVTGTPGQTEPQIAKNYISEYGMRIDNGPTNGMIINFKDEVMYNVNFNEKVYIETKFAEMMQPKDPQEQAQMDQMGKMMRQMIDSMEVNPTEETMKIGDWNCKKYIVKIMGMESVYWVTKDVKNYDDVAKYLAKYKKVFDKSPILKNLSSAFEMQAKIDGFPVKTINKMMGMEMVSTVKKVEEKKIDKKMFLPPEGFTKKVVEK